MGASHKVKVVATMESDRCSGVAAAVRREHLGPQRVHRGRPVRGCLGHRGTAGRLEGCVAIEAEKEQQESRGVLRGGHVGVRGRKTRHSPS